MNQYKTLCGLSIISMGLLIGACSSDKDVEIPPPKIEKIIPEVSYSGTAFDGLIIDGNVNIYAWNDGVRGDVLGSGVTDSKGNYEISIQSEDRPLLICVEGVPDNNAAHYVEEASESTVLLKEGDELCAVRTKKGGTLSTSLTFFTNLAYGLANYLVSTGMDASEAIDQSNRRVSTLIGIDIIDTVPLDITNIENATAFASQSHKYGLATAAISQYMMYVSVERNEEQSPHEFYNSMLFNNQAFMDIEYDGVLNGQSEVGMISLGEVAVNTETYRHILIENLFSMIASSRNRSGLGPTDVMEMALSWNNSNDTMFGGTPIVNLQTTRPSVTNVSIVDEEVLSATQTFSADISDVYGLENIRFYFDGVEIATFVEGDDYTYELDTTLHDDGSHTLRIDTSNLVGGERNIELNVTISNHQTTIANVNPADGAYVRGDFNFTASVTDPLGIDNVNVLIDNIVFASPTDVNLPAVPVDSTTLNDGDHSFSVIATNAVGFDNRVNVTYTVDNTPPVVGLIDLNDGDYINGLTTLSPTATDTIGLLNAQLLFNGQMLSSYATFDNALSPFNLNTTSFDDDTHTVAITAIDHAGNSTVHTLNLIIDNTPPVINITAPVNGSYHAESFNIVANVTESVGVESVNYYADDLTLNGAQVDLNTVDDGERVLKVIATDNAGHSSEASVNVVIDTTPPVVNITYPIADSLHKTDFLITADVTDATPIAATQYYVDNTQLPTSLVNIGSLSDGAHRVSVRAEDSMGFVTTHEISLITDANAPALSITNPVQNEKIQGEIFIRANVSDARGIATVQFLLDGNHLADADNPSIPSVPLNTTKFPNGEHSVTVIVSDLSGYTTTSTVNFTISNPAAILDSFSFYLSGTQCRGAGTFSGVKGLTKVEIWKPSIPPAANVFVADITGSLNVSGSSATFDSSSFIKYPRTHQYLRVYNNVGDWFPTEIWDLYHTWTSAGPTGCHKAGPNPAYQVVP